MIGRTIRNVNISFAKQKTKMRKLVLAGRTNVVVINLERGFQSLNKKKTKRKRREENERT